MSPKCVVSKMWLTDHGLFDMPPQGRAPPTLPALPEPSNYPPSPPPPRWIGRLPPRTSGRQGQVHRAPVHRPRAHPKAGSRARQPHSRRQQHRRTDAQPLTVPRPSRLLPPGGCPDSYPRKRPPKTSIPRFLPGRFACAYPPPQHRSQGRAIGQFGFPRLPCRPKPTCLLEPETCERSRPRRGAWSTKETPRAWSMKESSLPGRARLCPPADPPVAGARPDSTPPRPRCPQAPAPAAPHRRESRRDVGGDRRTYCGPRWRPRQRQGCPSSAEPSDRYQPAAPGHCHTRDLRAR